MEQTNLLFQLKHCLQNMMQQIVDPPLVHYNSSIYILLLSFVLTNDCFMPKLIALTALSFKPSPTLERNMTVSPSSFISFVSEIFPLLQIYAGSFFTIPLIRWFLVQKRNGEIERRNRSREQYAQVLERPDVSLRRKLLSARDMAQRTFIGQDRIVYSTDRDLYEQDYDAQQWEKRFREIEKSE